MPTRPGGFTEGIPRHDQRGLSSKILLLLYIQLVWFGQAYLGMSETKEKPRQGPNVC